MVLRPCSRILRAGVMVGKGKGGRKGRVMERERGEEGKR